MPSETEARPAALRYQTSYEKPADDEDETGEKLLATVRKIQQTTYEHGNRPLRAAHAKSHGLLRGTLHVLGGLAPELAQGIYAEPTRFAVAMRLSTSPGELLDDSVSMPRGLGLKLIGVPGERLPGSEGDVTQDYVLVNASTFMAHDAKGFAGGFALMAAATDRAPGAKKLVSALMRGAEHAVEAFGAASPALLNLGGQPLTHILGETFYSAAPLLHGSYMAKVAVRPVSESLRALTKAPLDLTGRPDGLREAVFRYFAEQGGEWELCVQLCTDIDAMPIEDAKVEWPEDQSPYRPVARIVVPPQPAWSATRARALDEGLSFSPWHGVAAHRPLGSVMRARKLAYEAARRFRAEHGGRPIAEPRSAADLPN